MKKARALLIPADRAEPMREVVVQELEDLNTLVGGSIEYVPFPGRPNVAPYIHEEGKFVSNVVVNDRATLMFDNLMPGDFIAGAMVILAVDDEGDNADCPDDLLALATG